MEEFILSGIMFQVCNAFLDKSYTFLKPYLLAPFSNISLPEVGAGEIMKLPQEMFYPLHFTFGPLLSLSHYKLSSSHGEWISSYQG